MIALKIRGNWEKKLLERGITPRHVTGELNLYNDQWYNDFK